MKLYKTRAIEAHRGARGLVQFENTIEAFQKAIEVGADGIELDLRKTKDGVIVIRHNPDYNGELLANMTYNELLTKTKKDGFIIPTLEETLKFCKGKTFLDIELKESGYEEEIINIVLKHLTYDEFYIRSFIKRTIKKVKKLDSNIKTILLLGVTKARFSIFSRLAEIFPLFLILYTKCDIVSPHRLVFRFFYHARMKLLRKPVIVWTVNSEKELDKLLNIKKVDAIITDFPDIAVKIRK